MDAGIILVADMTLPVVALCSFSTAVNCQVSLVSERRQESCVVRVCLRPVRTAPTPRRVVTTGGQRLLEGGSRGKMVCRLARDVILASACLVFQPTPQYVHLASIPYCCGCCFSLCAVPPCEHPAYAEETLERCDLLDGRMSIKDHVRVAPRSWQKWARVQRES